MSLSAYCTNADVAAEFKNIDFTKADAAVSSSKVDEWIAQASSEINNRLSVRYLVPFTTAPTRNISDDGISLIKQCCIWLVAQRVTDAVESKTVRQETNSAIKTDTASRARKILQEIAANTLPLIGATPAKTSDGSTSYISSNEIPNVRTFTKTGVEW